LNKIAVALILYH